MKKLFAVLAIACSLVACDNAASDQEKRTKDSMDSVKRQDSINALTPAPTPMPTPSTGDTMNMNNNMGGDTMNRTSGDTMNRQ